MSVLGAIARSCYIVDAGDRRDRRIETVPTLADMSPTGADSIRIDDLFDPVFPDGVGDALDAMDEQAASLDWSPASIRADASAATGLEDFGDDLPHRGLALLAELAAASPNLRASGLVTFRDSLVHNAGQRLLIVDYLARHPEVHDIEIARPIVIAGQPRTGTTHLHNLLAADPALRSLEYWEACEPVPPTAEQQASFEVDPRYTRTEDALAGLNYVLPHFRRMHDMYTAHVHEEIELMRPAFGGMLWETALNDGALRDRYLATDQTPMYEWMRTVLKVCTHVGGGDRWVLKSPQHVEQLGPLLTVFPDATVVCTHRDPVAVAASMATMVTYAARTSTRPDRLADVGRYWIERIERMFQGLVAGRDLVPAHQSIDVRFQDFMADDIAMVERIYALADQPFTPNVRTAMEAFMADHPRGKHGRVRYDLADFGVDPAERRRALQFYVDRFGVAIE